MTDHNTDTETAATPEVKLSAKLFRPFGDIASLFWMLVFAMSGAALFGKLSTLSGGLIDVSTKEQDALGCIIRQLSNEELEADAKVASAQGCIPKKVKDQAEE